ncbi:MAG: hypothetical protein U0931_19085 [Vulcanimicrobiota bacterium]
MENAIELWTRPLYQPSAQRSFLFWVVWLDRPAAELFIDPKRHGFPGGPSAGLELDIIEDSEWLGSFLHGPIANMADFPLEPLGQCPRAVLIRGHFPDSAELRALQTGMAFLKAYVDLGALAAIDLVATRWWQPSEIMALRPDRPFDPHEHISVVSERGEEHFCNTRGMAKFARPELFVRKVPAHRIQEVADTIWGLARQMADGKLLTEHPQLRAWPDDTDQDEPAHGIAPSMFRNSSLELVL